MFYCQIHNHYSFTELCPVCFPFTIVTSGTEEIKPEPDSLQFIRESLYADLKFGCEEKCNCHAECNKAERIINGLTEDVQKVIEQKDKEIERLKKDFNVMVGNDNRQQQQIQSLTDQLNHYKEFCEQFEQDPYPEDIFTPLTSEQLKQTHFMLLKEFRFSIDRLTGHIGRLLRNSIREQYQSLKNKQP